MRKKILIGVAIILLSLIITNPSDSDFRSYLKMPPNTRIFGIGRDANFMIGSIYECSPAEKYLGIADNFFLLSDTTTKK
jgi:hypothetical protein